MSISKILVSDAARPVSATNWNPLESGGDRDDRLREELGFFF
jgi:hypothetical protein